MAVVMPGCLAVGGLDDERPAGYRSGMRLIFIHGTAASGKFTVGRELARLTGLPLFHNHLVVDAVAAVFPFGTDAFIRLRESFWVQTFAEAAKADRSLIFTFQPEPTVSLGFPDQVREIVEGHGGSLFMVALDVSATAQERRIGDPGRAKFGKLVSRDLLRELRESFDASMAAMPAPDLRIDTESCDPIDAATRIRDIAGL
jgi:hypothetical protein